MTIGFKEIQYTPKGTKSHPCSIITTVPTQNSATSGGDGITDQGETGAERRWLEDAAADGGQEPKRECREQSTVLMREKDSPVENSLPSLRTITLQVQRCAVCGLAH